MLFYNARKGITVEHGENFTFIGDLHRRSTGIGIAGYDMLSEPLGGNHKLLAKFAGTKKQYFFHRRILF